MRGAGRLICVVAVLALASGCVSVAEFRKLENKVYELEGGDVGQQTREQLADLSAQVDALTQEVAGLRGTLEVTSHQSQRALSEAEAARRDAAVPGAPPPPPDQLPPDAGEPSSDAQIDGSPGAAPAGSAEEVAAYRAAYGAWRRNEVQACIEGFREFLQTFESSPYADDALYWMADCYETQGDNEKAILRFANVVERYPDGNKAPDALFRQGEVLLKLGPGYQKAARDVFERVVSEYPDSPRAAEAKRQLNLLSAG
jgi:tol-pal system protein YbgF